jgi:sugar (pentulose or hexulose) kinase
MDIGTTGAKAALLDSAGQALRSAYREYPTQAGAGGMMEQDGRDWWQAAASAAAIAAPMPKRQRWERPSVPII